MDDPEMELNAMEKEKDEKEKWNMKYAFSLAPCCEKDQNGGRVGRSRILFVYV